MLQILLWVGIHWTFWLDWLRQVIAELAAARATPFAVTRLVSHSPSPDSQNGGSLFP